MQDCKSFDANTLQTYISSYYSYAIDDCLYAGSAEKVFKVDEGLLFSVTMKLDEKNQVSTSNATVEIKTLKELYELGYQVY